MIFLHQLIMKPILDKYPEAKVHFIDGDRLGFTRNNLEARIIIREVIIDIDYG